MKWDKMLTGKSECTELFFVHFFFFFSVLAAFCKFEIICKEKKKSTKRDNTGSGEDQSLNCGSASMLLWTRHLTSLGLCFLISKTKIIMVLPNRAVSKIKRSSR